MQLDAIQQVTDARETTLRIFERHAPDQSMNLVTERQ
jgi:hypothetical protein